MKARTVVLCLGIVIAAAGASLSQPEALVYEVQELDGKLLLETDPEPVRLDIGDRAASGDRLRTKGSSQAVLFVRSHATHFLLGPKTTCTLAHDRPGVLLHVERGRLRAVFDAFTGEGPRLVTTPSAVLAVRGTEYGLEVQKDGDTHLVVFEGTVEVTDPAGETAPVMVEAGHQTRIRSNRQPTPPSEHRLRPQDWDSGHSTTPRGEGGTGFGSSGSGGASGAPGAGSSAGKGGSKRRGG